MEIVIAIVGKIAQYTVEPVGRQMGYLFFYNNNIIELKNQVEKLAHAKQRVQQSVGEAERNRNEIFEDVKKWLKNVDGITVEANKLADDASQAKPSCSNWSCLNLKSRHQLSRKANKMSQVVSTIVGEGSLLDGRGVSYCAPPQGIGTGAIKGYEVFGSRNSTLSGVIEALKSNNINKIGVYGMGGVGKTMLVNEVARQAKQDKLFDKVVMVVISQTPNIKEIQEKIAHVLDLKFDVESTRADQLRERLNMEKNILVIIDDIWEELDLEVVGISFGDDQKGCKLLFTSRSKDVLLSDMSNQKIFGLGVVSNDEARYLFGKIVGDLAKHTDFHPVAVDILKECAGLPIAITTIANALKNRSLPVWKDAVQQLRRSSPTNINGMHKKVYSGIELSYKFLSEEAKSLFLLCSLHKEDYEIEVNSLLRYGMGLDLFQEVYSWEEARNRIHTLVENLKSSSLLLDGDEVDTVKMHDIIRDAAIHIAAKDRHMFNVGDEVKLLKWSKEKKLKDSTAISLPFTNVCELPERLECPRLSLFLLFNKNRILQIPHPFFEGTKELRVLHFLRMNSQFLSSSLSFLQNLQTLCLNACELENIALIGELKNLKVLNLSRSNIKELPKEISQLTNLQVLDLSYCSKLEIIPANVLSNLKGLEELDMKKSFTSWEVEEESIKGSTARVTELDHLSHLTTLNIHIPRAKFLPKALIFEKLVRYKIFIGDDCDWYLPFQNSRTLTLKLNISLQSKYLVAIKILLKSCEDLYLDKLKDVQNIFCELSSDGFPWLKHLQIDNAEIQYIIKGLRCVAFPVLESFSLNGIINLEKICHGQLAVGSFHNLRNVEVECCDNLKFIFSSSMVGCFPQLQKMMIADCKVMSTIVAMEREDEMEINDDTKDMMEFTQLQSLTLDNLPSLMCFHSDVDSLLLFNEKVSFKNLTTLTVRSCGSLKHLLSSSMVRSLVQLKDLEIYKCKVMEEIIAIEESCEEKRMDSILFPKLEFLDLQDLPKLIRFCFENVIEFPSLKALKITDCAELKTFVSNSLSTNLTVNQEIEEMNNCATQSLFSEKVSFKNLTTLTVRSCGSLKYLLSSSMARSLVQLKDLEVYKCEVMEEILATEESGEKKWIDNVLFPKLESLDLWDLPKLMRFCFENFIEFPSLKALTIKDCPELKTFVSNSLSTNMTVNKELAETNNCATQSLFNEKVLVPNLLKVVIDGIDNLRIWHNKLIPDSFCTLNEMMVFTCKNIIYIFPSNIQRRLWSLKILMVIDCELIEDIFEIGGANVKEDGDIVATQLRSLYLRNLTKLKNVWNMNPQGILLTFQNLQTVTVGECGSLKSLFPASVAKHLTQLESLMIFDCAVEDIVAKEEGLETEPKFVFPLLNSLKLQNLPELKSFYIGKHTSEWSSLKNLEIKNCAKVKIFASDSLSFQETHGQGHHGVSFEQPLFLIEKVSFPELEELTLMGNFAMNEIWHGHSPIEFFSKLKVLKLHGFHDKSVVFPDGFLQKLHNLETLHVEDSHFREIFLYEELGEEKHGGTLARFKNLQLDGLPELVHLWKEDSQADPFFQKLEILEVSKCLKLKNLVPSSISFQNLTSLRVSNCHGLLNLITYSTAKSLVQLTRMFITDCKNMTEIVVNEGGEARDDEILFTQLKTLELCGLPSLTSFYLGNCNIKFPSLKKVRVQGCPKLKIFFEGILSTPKLQRVDITKTYEGFWFLGQGDVVTPTEELGQVNLNTTVKRFWENNFNKSEDQSFTDQKGETSTDNKEHDMDIEPESNTVYRDEHHV